ncbi:hypothetical protein [Desulfitobacterium dichloroeliminans]|uniref:hypothetical protein n=1 Tax=Desulfitobacterium dichloroeliminans TaxID=233055 RepID=UPI00030D9695|nr:hypothetical protein [Desulfitobacterium dichloroeliminans]
MQIRQNEEFWRIQRVEYRKKYVCGDYRELELNVSETGKEFDPAIHDVFREIDSLQEIFAII